MEFIKLGLMALNTDQDLWTLEEEEGVEEAVEEALDLEALEYKKTNKLNGFF